MSSLAIISNWLEELPIIASKTMVKTLGTDPVPNDMGIGMKSYILDPEWCWIAKDGERANGFLAASPCHGTVLVWRLVVRERAPLDTLPILLRYFVRDCKKRGYIGLFSYLDPKSVAELFFMKAISLMGGTVFRQPQFLIAADFKSLERW